VDKVIKPAQRAKGKNKLSQERSKKVEVLIWSDGER
jgi:hypothetical protein